MIIIDQIYLVREQKVTAEPILLLCTIHLEFIYINRGPARPRPGTGCLLSTANCSPVSPPPDKVEARDQAPCSNYPTIV
jgi:hypothetical protein